MDGRGVGKAGRGADTTRAFYVGNSTAAERRDAQERQVLFTTYAMSREALDIPALDTLVMATPVGAIEQVIGRILRRHPGKQAPAPAAAQLRAAAARRRDPRAARGRPRPRCP